MSVNAIAAVIAPTTPIAATTDSSGTAGAGATTTDAIAALGTAATAGAQAAAGQKTGTAPTTAPAPTTDTANGDATPSTPAATGSAGDTAQAQLAAGIQTANANAATQTAAGSHAPAHAGSTDPSTGVPSGGSHTDGTADNQANQPLSFAANLPTQPGPAMASSGQAAAAAMQPLASAASAAANSATAGAAAAATAPTQNAANMGAIPLAAVPVEIAAQAKAGTNRFEIRLDPPDLGRIDVQLNVDKQGNVTSHLVVDRSSTLDMLRRDAPQLQRALQDAGLKTGSDTLQFSLRDQGANAQSQQQQNFQNGSTTRTARIAVPTDEVQPVPTASNYGRLYGATGGLDIRV